MVGVVVGVVVVGVVGVVVVVGLGGGTFNNFN